VPTYDLMKSMDKTHMKLLAKTGILIPLF